MDPVRNGLMSGEDLVDIFSGGTKNKVFFFVRSSPESASITGGPSSSKLPAADMVDLTTPPPKGGKSTRAFLTKMARKTAQHDSDCCITDSRDKDHVQVLNVEVLNEEPVVVGDATEDLSLFGFSSEEKKKGGFGRTEEVAIACESLMAVTGGNLPPFVTHSLDELFWQARLDRAVCLLVLFSSSSLQESEVYVNFLFKILKDEVQTKYGRFLFWLADSQSDEGNKVQAKYGVGDQTAVLILVPSHIPQCVEIFEEANIDRNKLKEALAKAQKLCNHLQDENNVTQQDATESADQKIKEKQEEEDLEEEGKGKEEWNTKENEKHDAEDSSDEESDREVQFGPGVTVDGMVLEDTLEDTKDETKKTKKKKKKKKKKKNRKRKNKGIEQLDEKIVKKVCPEDGD